VRARLDDPSLLHDVDDVRADHRGQPVRDGERGATLGGLVQRFLDHPLRDGVERGRRLVQQQHGRILQQHPRDRDALLLAAGEAIAALPHHGVVAVLEAGDHMVDVGRRARRDELLVGRVGLGIDEVLPDRGVEQVGLLRHDPDLVDDRLLREVAHVGAVEEHRPLRRLVEPRREVEDRRLARAGGAHEGHVLARLGGERDPLQGVARGGRRIGVAEPHVAELQPAARAGGFHRGARIRRVLDLGHQVEVLEDAREQRLRGLHVERDPHEPDQRHEQARLHGRERHDRAGGDRPGAARDEEPCDEIDDRRHARHQHRHHREEPLPAHRRAHLEADLGAVLRLIARRLRALPVERLRQQDPGDAQRLLRDGGELGQRLLRLSGDPRAHLSHPALHEHQDGHHAHGDDGQPPVQHDHRDERGDHRDGVAEDARDRAREHAGDAADVVLQAGLDDTGLGAREEAQLHRLQVLEQPHAQVARDAVADGGGEPGLHDAQPGRQQVQADHRDDQDHQQIELRSAPAVREQRVVEHLLHQERRDDAERGADDDEQDRHQDPVPVGPEQPDHSAPEVGDPGCVRVLLALCRLVDGAAAAHAAHPGHHAHPPTPLPAAGRPRRRHLPFSASG
jgi:hypothetical protein